MTDADTERLPNITYFWIAQRILAQQRAIVPLLEYVRDEADRLLAALEADV
jgi:hypothetical protein